MKPIEYAQTIRRLNERLAKVYTDSVVPAGCVLEAGGGSFTHFELPPHKLQVVLDIDFGQLRRNATGALCVQADLERLPMGPSSCAMILCFNVMEHLDRPDLALDQMIQSLQPGGLLLLGFPERSSLKGWITRITPLGVHRWFYRYIVGKPDRGGEHYDAFATPFHPMVSHTTIQHRLAELGCELLQFDAYDGSREYGLTVGSLKRRLVGLPYYAMCRLGEWLSLGRWQPALSDVLLLARKRSTAGLT